MTIKRPLNKLAAFSLFILFAGNSWGGLSKTYPTSPVTTLRIEAFTDIFQNLYSTYSVQVDTWDVVADSYTFVPSNQKVTGWILDTSTIPYLVKATTWTISEYTDLISEQSRRHDYNVILDNDVEQFMVWPDTSPVKGWKGWCLGTQKIPIVCP